MNLKDQIWQALEEVIDPELGVNIVDLGLVYELHVGEQKHVDIKMTMTIPECPMIDEIVEDVRKKVKSVPGVRDVNVELVWEPAWTPARMTDKGIEEVRRRQRTVT